MPTFPPTSKPKSSNLHPRTHAKLSSPPISPKVQSPSIKWPMSSTPDSSKKTISTLAPASNLSSSHQFRRPPPINGLVVRVVPAKGTVFDYTLNGHICPNFKTPRPLKFNE